jgi:hypothetical protein
MFLISALVRFAYLCLGILFFALGSSATEESELLPPSSSDDEPDGELRMTCFLFCLETERKKIKLVC